MQRQQSWLQNTSCAAIPAQMQKHVSQRPSLCFAKHTERWKLSVGSDQASPWQPLSVDVAALAYLEVPAPPWLKGSKVSLSPALAVLPCSDRQIMPRFLSLSAICTAQMPHRTEYEIDTLQECWVDIGTGIGTNVGQPPAAGLPGNSHFVPHLVSQLAFTTSALSQASRHLLLHALGQAARHREACQQQSRQSSSLREVRPCTLQA